MLEGAPEPSVDRHRTGPQSAGRGYDAFISYSHAADGTLAPTIQHGLEALAKPLYQRRALRLFRDKTSLAVTPALWPTIQRALEASRYFILLASPTAAQSPWVQQELAWWTQHREPETLLIVLTAGTISWDKASGDFAWDSTDALPRGLSGWFGEEPLWVDFSWAREASRLSPRNPRLQDAVATMAAPLRGVPKDDLVGRDIVLHRRTVRLTQVAVALLVLLALGAASGALVAVSQRNTAREQTLTATSRQLVAETTSIEDAQPNLARQLLVEAYRLAPTDQAAGALFGSSSIPRVIPTRGNSRSVAYSPHRDVLAIASDEGVTLYDASTATALATLSGQRGYAGAIAFSQDDRLLAAGYADGSIRLWDVTSARHPTLLGAVRTSAGTIQDLTFSARAPVLIFVAESSGIGVLNIQTRHDPRMIAAIPGFATAGLRNGLAVSADGRVMVSAGEKNTMRLWDLSMPRSPTPFGQLEGPGGSIAFSPNGQLLAAGGGDDVTRLWDVGDPMHPRQRAILTSQSLGIDAVVFAPDGATLATGAGDGTIQLWNVADPIRPTQGARLTGHTDSIAGLAFSGDGRTLASASADGAATAADGSSRLNGSVRLWSVIGSDRSAALARLSSAGSSLPAFTADSHTMAAGSPMTLWDLSDRASPRAVATVPTFAQGQPAVSFSPDGHALATGVPVVLWDVTDRAHPRTLTPRTAVTDAAEVVSFSPTAHILVTGNLLAAVKLWDVSQPGRPTYLTTLQKARSAPQGVAFRPDGRILATLTGTGAVQLWDVSHPSSPELRKMFGPDNGTVKALAFSDDGRTLLTGASTGVVTAWDVRDPEAARELGSVGRHTGPVNGLAYQPGGTIAASASDDGVRLWNVSDPSRPVEMTALSAGGRYDWPVLSFSPDGQTLAAASEHGLQLWDVDVLGILQRLCVQSPPITRTQWTQYLPDRPYDPPCA